jgi:serine/threonine protein kinase
MIGKILHDFRIISEVGEGGMGVVYLAEHTRLPRRFAIKSLSRALSNDPHFHQRFYQEARNQALLDHPNIVQVTNFFEEGGQYFLVMDYVDGQDLSKLIRTRGKLSPNDALDIFKDILSGLGFAHSKGIIHRDMKSSNVLIDKSGRVRITDFGIAILAGAENQRLTATGATVGSPWYMSPEQITRPQNIDHRSDIYSLGIVLYEMLTGDVPFDGETDFSVKQQQVHSPAPNPRQKNPEISGELSQIIRKAMAKDPRERFQDCSEFLQHIQECRKTKENTRPQFLLLRGLLLTILILVSIGIIQNLREPEVTPDPNKDEWQRQAAFNVIQSASEKALLICSEFERLRRKQETLANLQQIQYIDTNAIDSLKKQIQEHQENIEDALSGYSDFVTKLADFRSTIVDEEFGKYARLLEKKNSFRQVHTTRLMKLHYQQYHDGRKKVNVETMHEACAQVLG